jgi:FkbM family methyltransferase
MEAPNMSLMLKQSVHSTVASLSRQLPSIRGKSRAGAIVTRLLRPQNLMRIRMRDGSLLRLDPRSETERPAVWTGDYELSLIAGLSSCLRPGDVAFDIGANVGFWSVPLARILSALNGHLYSFEPVLANFERLQENLKLNELAGCVTCVRSALGDEEGSMELATDHRNGASTGNAVILRGSVAACMTATDTAPVARLDRLVDQMAIHRCRFIKIDIEGAESLAFRGAREFLGRSRPIVYGEFCPYWMQQLGTSFRNVMTLFAPWGYMFFRRTRGGFARVHEPDDRLRDVLLVPAGTPPDVLTSMGVAAT